MRTLGISLGVEFAGNGEELISIFGERRKISVERRNNCSMEFLLLMILGVMTYVFLVWVSFADFVGIALKLLPLKTPRGYEEIKKIRCSEQFKKHKKRWTKKYMVLMIVYIITYFFITVAINDFGLGFLISFVMLVLAFVILNNAEHRQRNKLGFIKV